MNAKQFIQQHKVKVIVIAVIIIVLIILVVYYRKRFSMNADIQNIISSARKFGVTNRYAQAAMLATLSKETQLTATSENMNYTAERLVEVFPSYFPTVDAAQPYAHNPQALANYVYGGRFGNTVAGDGWKYRGRGYNGITFYDNYAQIGPQIGVDLVNNPDALLNPKTAADAAVVYFIDRFANSGGKLKDRYGAEGINDFKNLDSAVTAFVDANAGWPNSLSGTVTQEGLTRALAAAPTLYSQIA